MDEDFQGTEQETLLSGTPSFPVKCNVEDRVIYLIAESWKMAAEMIVNHLKEDDVLIQYINMEIPSLDELNSTLFQKNDTTCIRISEEMNNDQNDRIVVQYFW